jgi:hypothetical protein
MPHRPATALDLRAKPCSVVVVLGALVPTLATSSRALALAAQVELAAAGAVLLVLAGLLLLRELRRYRAARPHDDDEVRARALMGELCPNGWQAQITMFGAVASAPPDAPRFESGGLVAIDWAELPGDDDEQPVVRRVWAPSIAAALDAMVEDRRTDEVLERIERTANADDDPWDDV